MVFGARLAERDRVRLTAGPSRAGHCGRCSVLLPSTASVRSSSPSRRAPGRRLTADPKPDVAKLRDSLQRAMTGGAGVVRSAESLEQAAEGVSDVAAALGDRTTSVAAGELGNLLQLADALLVSARTRTESRGAHSRSDYPDTEPRWRLRQVHGAPQVHGEAQVHGPHEVHGAPRVHVEPAQ